jgi:hypothetical protein
MKKLLLFMKMAVNTLFMVLFFAVNYSLIVGLFAVYARTKHHMRTALA